MLLDNVCYFIYNEEKEGNILSIYDDILKQEHVIYNNSILNLNEIFVFCNLDKMGLLVLDDVQILLNNKINMLKSGYCCLNTFIYLNNCILNVYSKVIVMNYG